MNKSSHEAPDRAPFSYRVNVGHISANPVRVRLEADAKERAALAELWKVTTVGSLTADLQIGRWKKDGVRIRGTVDAEIVQECVVSLEPVPSRIHETIDQIFVPEGSKLARIATDEAAQLLIDPDGPDLPETFSGDSIDAGAVAAEFAALGIDPYPRKSDAALPAAVAPSEDVVKKPSPFAVLKDWKDR